MLELWALGIVGIGFGFEFGPGVGFGSMAAAYILMPIGGTGRMRAIERVADELAHIREMLKEKK
jgi:hypothetical protein